MFRKAIMAMMLFLVCSNATLSAQVNDFRFINWPLESFDAKSVLTDYSQKHFGVDIKSEQGTDVKVVASGKVYWTYSGGSHGISVGVEHENGFRTTYLHLSERLVKKGQEVKASEIIGKVGITGTGRDAIEPHLHFALIKDSTLDVSNPNRYANPLEYGPILAASNETIPKKELNPAAEPIIEPIVQPVVEPIVDPIMQPVAQPITQPSVEPIVEPMPQPVNNSLLSPLADNLQVSVDQSNLSSAVVSRSIMPLESKLAPKQNNHITENDYKLEKQVNISKTLVTKDILTSAKLTALTAPVTMAAILIGSVKFDSVKKQPMRIVNKEKLSEFSAENRDFSKFLLGSILLFLAITGYAGIRSFDINDFKLRAKEKGKLLSIT